MCEGAYGERTSDLGFFPTYIYIFFFVFLFSNNMNDCFLSKNNI